MPYQKFLFICLMIGVTLISHQSIGAVLVKNKIWTENQLNVVFIDGSEAQKSLVRRYAPFWLVESRLHFEFFDGFDKAPANTHIRVSFSSHTGSELGDHGDYLSQSATLLLNQLNDESLPESRKRRLILHEFGHALGLEHEYRNPKWPYGSEVIDQLIAGCIPRMQALEMSDIDAKQKCIENNQGLNKAQVLTTIYDEQSIMNYPLEINRAGQRLKHITAKSVLSVLDKLAIRQWYGNEPKQ